MKRAASPSPILPNGDPSPPVMPDVPWSTQFFPPQDWVNYMTSTSIDIYEHVKTHRPAALTRFFGPDHNTIVYYQFTYRVPDPDEMNMQMTRVGPQMLEMTSSVVKFADNQYTGMGQLVGMDTITRVTKKFTETLLRELGLHTEAE